MTDRVVAKSSHKTLNGGLNVDNCVHVTALVVIFPFLNLSEAGKKRAFHPATHTTHDLLQMRAV